MKMYKGLIESSEALSNLLLVMPPTRRGVGYR